MSAYYIPQEFKYLQLDCKKEKVIGEKICMCREKHEEKQGRILLFFPLVEKKENREKGEVGRKDSRI